MQQKAFRDKLLEQKQAAEQRNLIMAMLQFLTLMIFAVGGEVGDLPLSRIISLVVLVLIYRKYDQVNHDAGRALLYHDAEAKFFRAAAEDNINIVKKFLSIFKFQGINKFDPETGKNALHFAVEKSAINVINLFAQADRRIASMPEFCNNPSILNHQDNEGNTPVHYAIKSVLENYMIKSAKGDQEVGKYDFNILAMLINLPKEEAMSGIYGYELAPRNPRIDMKIENSEGKSIKDLIGKLFRTLAQRNNVDKMKVCLSFLTLKNLTIAGPDTGRNALHFAICQRSLDAIRFLVAMDKRYINKAATRTANIEELRITSILNQTDKNGNTPVHDAVMDLIKGRTQSYKFLFELLCDQTQSRPPNYPLNSDPMPYNELIDPTISNGEDLTILDLLNKLPKSWDQQKAVSIVSALIRDHEKQRENDTKVHSINL